MLLNIRERSQKVLACFCKQAKQSLRAISAATGIPKSSVHDDGSTAAQRLFGKPFPVVFDWVVLNLGELPSPRKSISPQISKQPTLQAVPS